MVTIGDKQVVYETTILLHADESAWVVTPEIQPITLRLIIGPKGVMPPDEDKLKAEMQLGEVTMRLPFLPANYAHSSGHSVQHQGKDIDVHIAAHGRGDLMVVHLQCRGAIS